MSQRDPKCSNPNAFSSDFLAELSRREPAPATPEADLAYLAAAALAVAERTDAAGAFRFQDGADRRLHLLHHGRPVGTSLSPISVGATPSLSS